MDGFLGMVVFFATLISLSICGHKYYPVNLDSAEGYQVVCLVFLVFLEGLVAMGVTVLFFKPIQYVSKKYDQWQAMDLAECEKLTIEKVTAPLKLNLFMVSCYLRLASIVILFITMTGLSETGETTISNRLKSQRKSSLKV
jgi:hypothetical protein